MKILYLYNGAPLEKNNLDKTWGTSQGLAYFLRSIGHEIVEINFKKQDLADSIDQELSLRGPDVVILSEAGTIPEHVQKIWNKNKFPKTLMVAEGCDEPQSIKYNLSHTMPADLVWSPDADSVKFYQSNGKNSFWMTHWGDELIYSFTPDPCNEKISTSSGPRRGIWSESVKALKHVFGDKFIAPRLGGENYISPLANNKLYAETSMVFQASSYGEITRRIFESALCGRAIICDKLESSKRLNEIFKEDEEIILFENVKDLIEKTRFYLTHHNQRMEIAEKAYKKCLSTHTALARAKELMNILELELKKVKI